MQDSLAATKPYWNSSTPEFKQFTNLKTMKYTAEDIKIHEPLSYNGMGLDINFSFNGESYTPLSLSNDALLLGLARTRNCIGTSLVWKEIEVSAHLPETDTSNPSSIWMPLETFMEKHFNEDMAKSLVLHHLNNKAEKP